MEMDETWIGGKTRTVTGISGISHRGADKTPIIGAVEREGNVVSRVLKRVTSEAMLNFVNGAVSEG